MAAKEQEQRFFEEVEIHYRNGFDVIFINTGFITRRDAKLLSFLSISNCCFVPTVVSLNLPVTSRKATLPSTRNEGFRVRITIVRKRFEVGMSVC